jgi:peptidoglycan/LPS O-acetylase OafA/YrhL
MTDTDNRIFGLDVMRAVAVLAVVYTHGYYVLGDDAPGRANRISFVDGVTLFFVLSGFLIGRILLRTIDRQDFDGRLLAQFWVRRWCRTLPNYLLVLSFLLIAALLMGRPLPASVSAYYLFMQNFASPHPNFFEEAWSLSIEEWFYLSVPIPLYLSTKLRDVDRRRLMLALMIVVIVSVTLFRTYRALHFGYSTIDAWDQSLRKQVVTRFDSLTLGVLAAYLSLYHRDLWRHQATLAFVFGVLLLLLDRILLLTVPGLFYRNYFALTVTPLGAVLLLPKLSSLKREGGWIVGTFTFISVVSYSMYLLNLAVVQGVLLPPLIRALSQMCWRCSQSHAVAYVLFWTLTITASFLLYRYFERPMTALRDKWPVRAHVSAAFASPAVPAHPGARGAR